MRGYAYESEVRVEFVNGAEAFKDVVVLVESLSSV